MWERNLVMSSPRLMWHCIRTKSLMLLICSMWFLFQGHFVVQEVSWNLSHQIDGMEEDKKSTSSILHSTSASIPSPRLSVVWFQNYKADKEEMFSRSCGKLPSGYSEVTYWEPKMKWIFKLELTHSWPMAFLGLKSLRVTK